MKFTHLDSAGQARMVDVTDKQPTKRAATASATVVCDPEILKRIVSGEMPKGDVLAVARIAGIAAAKRTPELLPLAHVIGAHGAAVDLTLGPEMRFADRTGVEMEALTAASVAALALIDMVKGLDRHAHIREVKLLAKEGGRSGSWRRDA